MEARLDSDQRAFERRLAGSRRLIALTELKEQSPTAYDLKLHELKIDGCCLTGPRGTERTG